MSGIASERFPDEERSILGAVLSFEFECSFAAAEANKAAYKLLDARHESSARFTNPNPPHEQIQIIGENQDMQTAEVIYLRSIDLKAEQPVRLALIEPIRTTQKEVDVVVKKMFRKHVRIETEQEVEKDQPVLVALFEDVALPLATFARRKDGVCSYVQLGSEIKSDNLHVIASDDLTSRNSVIEAIRAATDEKYTGYSAVGNNDTTTTKRQQALQTLLDIEFAQNKEQLAEAFEAQLVRKCTVETNRWRSLAVLSDNDNAYMRQRFNRKHILGPTLFDDHHLASLQVGRPVDGLNQDISQLFAITREFLALPLAQLNASTGQLTFESPALSSNPEERKQLVYQLLAILRDEPLIQHERMSADFFLSTANTQRRRVAGKIASMGKDKAIRIPDETKVYASMDNIDAVILHYFRNQHPFLGGELPDVSLAYYDNISKEIHRKAKEFLDNPFVVPNPYPDSQILGLAVSRLHQENERRMNIFAQLGMNNKLADNLGETTVEEERLVQKLFNMFCNSTVHRGVIENVPMNNTIADAIFQVNIELEGTVFVVTVSGKPEAMKDEPLRMLPSFCFSFDATHPIYSQLNGTKAHIGELLNTFDALSPVKQPRKNPNHSNIR